MIEIIDGIAKVPVERLKVLLMAEARLNMLEAGGVDNWEGIHFALYGGERTISDAEEAIVDLLHKGIAY